MKLLDAFSDQARGVAYSYDGWAHRYEEDVTQHYIYNAPDAVVSAIEGIAPKSVKNILDLGTGTGLVLEKMKMQFGDACLTGLDVSSRMLDKAKEKYGLRAKLHQCDIESDRWPAHDNSMDIITSAGALSMIGNLDHVLSEVHRTLKGDGVAALSFFIRNDFKKGPGLSVASPFKTHARQPEDMEHALQAHGFKTLKPIETFDGYGGNFFMERHGVIAFTKG